MVMDPALFQQKAQAIKLLILDVDGVLTNGKIIIHGNHGEELKAFHCHDGQGIQLLRNVGFEVAIITKRSSQAVIKRAEELNIEHIYQGQQNKIPAYEKLLTQLQLKPSQTAYMGDDLPDLPLMQRAGIAATVANSVGQIKQVADWISQHNGGEGAVREFCEQLLLAQKLVDAAMQPYL